jgi:predicted transcriptional regulator
MMAGASAATSCDVDFQLHLETETVEHCNPAKPICAAPDDPLHAVLKILKEARTGAAMVCLEGRLLGIFTERDALRVLADGIDLNTPVASAMIKNPATLRPGDTVARAIALMSAGGFRRLPIVDGEGQITGVLKVSNILRYLVEHFPKVIYTLPPEPHHRPSEREGA